MGMIHYLAYCKVREAKVAAICTRDPKKLAGDWRGIKGNFGPPGAEMDLKGVRKYAKFADLLADPAIDMVDLCLPPGEHAKASIAALKAGKHVLCEKPIALTSAEARRMVAAARAAERQLLVAHVLPFFAEYAFAWDAVRSGKYGRLLGGHFKRVISDPDWLPDFYDPHRVGGPMIDLHIHDAHFHSPVGRHADVGIYQRTDARGRGRVFYLTLPVRRSDGDRHGHGGVISSAGAQLHPRLRNAPGTSHGPL